MKWNNTGRGVWTCGEYTVSRMPNGKDYMLTTKERGRLHKGTKAACMEAAAKNRNPYVGTLQRLAKSGAVLHSFAALAKAQ